MCRSFRLASIAIAWVFLSLSLAAAEEDPYKNFPKSGVLAAQGNLPGADLALPQLPMGLTGEPVPLQGAISQAEQKWLFSVSNTTRKPIKAELEVRQYDGFRNLISSSKQQFKIKPGTKVEGREPMGSKAAGAILFLKNWDWLNTTK